MLGKNIYIFFHQGPDYDEHLFLPVLYLMRDYNSHDYDELLFVPVLKSNA